MTRKSLSYESHWEAPWYNWVTNLTEKIPLQEERLYTPNASPTEQYAVWSPSPLTHCLRTHQGGWWVERCPEQCCGLCSESLDEVLLSPHSQGGPQPPPWLHTQHEKLRMCTSRLHTHINIHVYSKKLNKHRGNTKKSWRVVKVLNNNLNELDCYLHQL